MPGWIKREHFIMDSKNLSSLAWESQQAQDSFSSENLTEGQKPKQLNPSAFFIPTFLQKQERFMAMATPLDVAAIEQTEPLAADSIFTTD